MSANSSSRVPIPNNLKKMIQDLKEIAKNHSDDEIYAMLQDCNMDPDETAQKLLRHDHFHEVKKKRDKRRDNNVEPADTGRNPQSQGRAGQDARTTNSSNQKFHDAGGERSVPKENGRRQVTDKGNTSSSPLPQETEIKQTILKSSSQVSLPNGHAKTKNPVPVQGPISKDSRLIGAGSVQIRSFASITNRRGNSTTGSVHTIKHNVKRVAPREFSSSIETNTSEKNNLYKHENVQGKSPRFDGNQFPDASQATKSLSCTSSAGSRPSSNYSNQSQQLNGTHKAVGPTMEWKPKAANVKPIPSLRKVETDKIEPTTTQEATKVQNKLDEPTLKLQNKLRELQLTDSKHVIIPNHLQVPESERTGLSFGSFDANFGLSAILVKNTESKKGSTELSLSSDEIVETVEESTSSIQIAPPSPQGANIDKNPHSSAEISENIASREPKISSSVTIAQEDDQSRIEEASIPDSSLHSLAHTEPTYSNFGLVPQMPGNQIASVESGESQVQQTFNPVANNHSSMYGPPTVDSDGRFSPSTAPGSEYSGNLAALPTQTNQIPQESGIALLQSSSGPAPLVAQAAGVMQSSIATNQQLFRQPPGVHISHYPPNYLPFNQYFAPFYLPTPSMISPFLSNTAFTQHSLTGNVYPPPGSVGSAPAKYSMPQYNKSSTNGSGNPNHIGMPVSSEDLAPSQHKDNNIYIPGQQNEGLVWIPTQVRDISAMQPMPFYNFLHSQGQHMTFPGVYHHAPPTVAANTIHAMVQQSQSGPGAVEMRVPPGGVYQQPQHTQINWVNNY